MSETTSGKKMVLIDTHGKGKQQILKEVIEAAREMGVLKEDGEEEGGDKKTF